MFLRGLIQTGRGSGAERGLAELRRWRGGTAGPHGRLALVDVAVVAQLRRRRRDAFPADAEPDGGVQSGQGGLHGRRRTVAGA